MKYRPTVKFFALANLLVMICIGVFIYNNLGEYRDSILARGDFPAFYSAGVLLRVDSANLYNSQSQAEVQQHYWSSHKGDYLYFAYLPTIAMVMAPLSLFGAEVAQYLWVFIQLCALALTLYLLNRASPVLKGSWGWDLLVALCFFPVVIAILSGQNATLSILLIASSIILASSGSRDKEILSGFVLGLLAFKPHFMLLVAAILVLSRGRAVLWGLFVSGCIQFSIVTAYFGFNWISDWFSAISFFNELENKVNLNGLVSFPQVIGSLSEIVSGGMGLGENLSLLLYLSIVTFAVLIVSRQLRNVDSKDYLHKALFVIPAVVVFLSPHTMYYDIALLVIPIFVLSRSCRIREIFPLLVLTTMLTNILVAYKPLHFGLILSILYLLFFVFVPRKNTLSFNTYPNTI